MKKEKKPIDLTALNLIITRWKLDETLLATEIDMPRGTFKNKRSPQYPQYQFTPFEYLRVCNAIGAIGDELSTFYKHEGRRMVKLIETAKTTKLS